MTADKPTPLIYTPETAIERELSLEHLFNELQQAYIGVSEVLYCAIFLNTLKADGAKIENPNGLPGAFAGEDVINERIDLLKRLCGQMIEQINDFVD